MNDTRSLNFALKRSKRRGFSSKPGNFATNETETILVITIEDINFEESAQLENQCARTSLSNFWNAIEHRQSQRKFTYGSKVPFTKKSKSPKQQREIPKIQTSQRWVRWSMGNNNYVNNRGGKRMAGRIPLTYAKNNKIRSTRHAAQNLQFIPCSFTHLIIERLRGYL